MPRRNWKSQSPDLILDRIRQAGFSKHNSVINRADEGIEELDKRIECLLHISKRKAMKNEITYLVMYDIENDKVRQLVAKYLISKGCIRIQNSIFMATTSKEIEVAIKTDLASVQETYENNDSIIIVPITQTNMDEMCIIGKEINLGLIKKEKKVMIL